jgi:signal transduction histidine kinase
MVTAIGDGAALDREIGNVLAAVAVAARLVAVPCVVVAVASGIEGGHFVRVPLAAACYTAVACWAVVYLLAALRGRPPGWVSAVDVGVVAAAMLSLRFAVDPEYFADVSNSALEPFAAAALVGVAIVAPLRRVVAACSLLGVVYLLTVTRDSADIMFNGVGDLSWQVGIALVCTVGAERLRRASATVARAARAVADDRERLAESRGRELERLRHRRAQQQAYLDLHDGPLALLTAMSRPAPVGHPDPEVRLRCAANANLLRGLLSDDAGRYDGAMPDLQLALVGAGADCAALGLRVRYQFRSLPEELDDSVVEALRGATRAALNNIVAHAGTGAAWVTAEAEREDGRPAVTVDIVDRGAGFDPAAVAVGLGLPVAIVGRMAGVGGAAAIDSVPGEGTWIRLRWPA